jgi:hypothetical protein
LRLRLPRAILLARDFGATAMLSRSFACAGLLLLGGCAYDAGYYDSNYQHDPASAAGYYSAVDYSEPYPPVSPVFRDPYAYGPVNGGIYVYGDERDSYGGPVFSPYHGIQCDRRRNICWSRNGPDYNWSYRFFGRRHAYWKNKDWHDGDWDHGGRHHGGWSNGGGHGHGNHGGGNNPNGPGNNNPNNDKPWVYQVPLEPDGSGAPTFYPNN